MKKELLIVTLLLLALTLSSPALTRGAYARGLFAEHFDGTTLDPAKWAIQENTNMSGYPAYGGSIEVADSHVVLSSNGSGFPCVTSAVNPFPETGDFSIEFNFRYTCISDWGNGLWISKGPVIGEWNSTISNVIFQLWAGNLDYDKAAIYVYLMGRLVNRAIFYGWEPSAPTQTFKLQCSGETYKVFINGVEVAAAESEMRPDTIGFGHPPIYTLPFSPSHVASVIGGWSSFEIDYIKLLQHSSISVSTSAFSTQLGFSVTINGTLNTTEGEPLNNANVILSYRVSGDSQWYAFASATTDANGAFSATWYPTATGTFKVRAAWYGNETHFGASDTKDISVARSTGETLFYAESNSTLSSLTFNSTANEVSFTVSGASGSMGYVRFVIAKSLIANMTALKVLVDGQQVACNVSSLDDSWELYFICSHSTHAVTIKMSDSSVVPEFPGWFLLLLVSACTVSAFIQKKKKWRT